MSGLLLAGVIVTPGVNIAVDSKACQDAEWLAAAQALALAVTNKVRQDRPRQACQVQQCQTPPATLCRRRKENRQSQGDGLPRNVLAMFRPHMPSLDLAQAALQSTGPSQGSKGPALAKAAAPDAEGECQAVQAFLEGRQHVVGLPCLAAELLEHLLGPGQQAMLCQAAISQVLELQQALPGVCPAAWCLQTAVSGNHGQHCRSLGAPIVTEVQSHSCMASTPQAARGT